MPLIESLKSFFLNLPLPDAAFELAAGYLSGIRISRRSRSARGRFILPLDPGGFAASFDRANVTDAASLKERIAEGKERLGLTRGRISVLIPEPCVRIFILTVDSVPGPQAEREAFIRWRIGKQMPLVHEDLVITSVVSRGGPSQTIMACMARRAVVQEYEELFADCGLSVGTVTVPSLGLINLLGGEIGAAGGLLLNVEDDYVSLLAFTESEWHLYRQKAFLTESRTSWTLDQKVDQVAKEISNTAHFLEDKEMIKVEKIWARSGVLEDGVELIARLQSAQDLPVEAVDYPAREPWDVREKAILAPLVGMIR